jgi:hypothetical protein
LRAVQPLAIGESDMKLRALDNAGVLAQVLNWHAISPDHHHRVVEISAVGNQIGSSSATDRSNATDRRCTIRPV